MKSYHTIDEYIEHFSPEIQQILTKIRHTIHQAAPEATEAISYGIPTFKQRGNLVHFAAYTDHIGFYPSPQGIAAFAAEIKPYHAGKGTLRFPLDQPIPYNLITKIVKYRLELNLAKKK